MTQRRATISGEWQCSVALHRRGAQEQCRRPTNSRWSGIRSHRDPRALRDRTGHAGHAGARENGNGNSRGGGREEHYRRMPWMPRKGVMSGTVAMTKEATRRERSSTDRQSQSLAAGSHHTTRMSESNISPGWTCYQDSPLSLVTPLDSPWSQDTGVECAWPHPAACMVIGFISRAASGGSLRCGWSAHTPGFDPQPPRDHAPLRFT